MRFGQPGQEVMARYGDRYSRLVVWLKVTLPLLALVLLSMLFFLPSEIDPNRAIPHSGVDVAELIRDPRITAPNYAGVTSDGAALTIRAAAARSDPEVATRLSVTGVHAEIETADGLLSTASAELGWIDREIGAMALEGGVAVRAAPGYALNTDVITAALDRTWLRADSRIEGSGPPGEISAGALVIEADPHDTGRYVLVFRDGVKLVYTPQPQD